MSFKNKGWFFGLLAGFVLLRLGILLGNVEAVSNFEELFRGAISLDMIQGLKWPVFEYQSDNYHAGSIAQAAAAMPFFKFLGPSLLSLKLAPLFFFSLPALALTCFWLRRHFGSRAALTGALLYIFAPPAFIANALYGMGFHVDSILFSSVMLVCFYEFFFVSRRLWLLFAAGFTAGFAIWLNYTAGLTWLACLPLFKTESKKKGKPAAGFLLMMAGFAGGLSPWIFYNLSHDAGGAAFLQSSFSAEGAGFFHALLAAVKKAVVLTAYWTPSSLGFHAVGGAPGVLLNYAWYLAAACTAWKTALSGVFRNRKFLPLGMYPVVFIGCYALARGIPLPMTLAFSDCRYFPPLHFFLILFCAAVSGRGRIPRAVGVMLAAGVVGAAAFFFDADWGKASQYKGYSYYRLAESRPDLWGQLPADWDELLKWFEQYPETERRPLFKGFMQEYPFEAQALAPEEISRRAARLERPYRGYWLEGLGFYLARKGAGPEEAAAAAQAIPEPDRRFLFMGYSMQNSLDPELRARMEKIMPKIPYAHRKYFYFFLGSASYDAADDLWFPARTVWEKLPEEDRAWFFRGIGACFSGFWIWSPYQFPGKFRALESRIPEEYRGEFYWGAGWGIRLELNEDGPRARAWLGRLPAHAQIPAARGLKAYDSFYGTSA